MIQLHNHSDASLLDGKQTIEEIVNYAISSGEKAIALTDHGNMINTYKFYHTCKKKDVKPIIGCEFYYVDKKEDEGYSHLVLLAKDNVGYDNLLKLQKYSYMEGFYRKPRIWFDLLKEHTDGLICLSACIGGSIPKLVFQDKLVEAHQEVLKFKGLFGEDFYLEIQPHDIERQIKWNTKAIEFSIAHNIEIVVTSDAHYVTKDEQDIHDTVICMGYHQKKFDTERRRYETTNEFKDEKYILENMNYISEDILKKAINNTYLIGDMCNVNLDYNDDLLPSISDNPKEELAKLCNKYFKEFNERGEFNDLNLNEVIERIKYELKVINEKGYADYFIITWDFINYARENDIPVGLGRGSIAGSMVAFLLGIHKLNPMRYGLLFERFLNPTRNSHVDVDSDFCNERREEVIEYVKNKYGNNHVSTVIANGTMATSNVIRKVLSTYGFEQSVINRVSTTYVPKVLGITLKEALEQSKELGDFFERNNPNILRDCVALEDNISHFSKHAAGIVISPKDMPVYARVPVMRDSDDTSMMKTQWDKKEVEAIGLYKFDFLGLKLLTTLGETVKNIKNLKGIDITLDDLYNIDVEDKVIYEVLNSGELEGVFQFSEYAGKLTIDKAKPQCFDDVMACESICRPGVKEAELYLHNKQYGYEKSGFKILDDILESTYGAIVYQEQTMIILKEVGGFTLGEADGLRKVKSLEPYKERFIEYAITTHKISRKLASDTFDRFSLEYSFNKSHAGVYGKTSCLTAYLLGKYFIEYMSAYISMEMLKTDDKSNLKECMQLCRNKGITFKAPDINVATNKFIPISENEIMLPITFIKGLGGKAIEHIVANRPYTSFEDFIKKVPKRNVNQTSQIKLIKAGAFDNFETNRHILLEKNFKFESMFWCDDLKIVYEREVLGLNLDKHPLDGYTNVELSSMNDNEIVSINAIITEVTKKIDKNGKEYAFIKCENKVCVFEGLVFAWVYSSLHSLLLPNAKVNILGKKDKNKIIVNKLSLI